MNKLLQSSLLFASVWIGQTGGAEAAPASEPRTLKHATSSILICSATG